MIRRGLVGLTPARCQVSDGKEGSSASENRGRGAGGVWAEGLVHSRFLSSRLYKLRIDPAGQPLREAQRVVSPSADPLRPECPVGRADGPGLAASSARRPEQQQQ